jgi:hypothetical protein
MMINKKIILFLNILIGILFVGFIFYRRVLVIRLPKSLWVFVDDINYFLLFTIILGISVSSYQLIVILYNIIKKNNIKSNFFLKLSQLVENALFELYNFICNCIPNIYMKVSTLAENFYALFHKYSEYVLLFVLYTIRILIVIIFLIDIFFFFKFDYFYKALYLLCISLCIKILLYILRDFANNLNQAESYLIIEDKGFDATSQLPITEFSLKEEYQKLNLDFYIKQYLLCSKLSGYFIRYDKYSTVFSPYINLFIYSLYFIGWFYVLFKNLL